jgi:hypothetical protein
MPHYKRNYPQACTANAQQQTTDYACSYAKSKNANGRMAFSKAIRRYFFEADRMRGITGETLLHCWNAVG